MKFRIGATGLSVSNFGRVDAKDFWAMLRRQVADGQRARAA